MPSCSVRVSLAEFQVTACPQKHSPFSCRHNGTNWQVNSPQYFLKGTRLIPHLCFSTDVLLHCSVWCLSTEKQSLDFLSQVLAKKKSYSSGLSTTQLLLLLLMIHVFLLNSALCSVPNVHTWPCSTSSSSEHSAQLPHKRLIMFYCNCSF